MGAPEDLRAWRGERTLRQAADLIGCDPSYLSLLENRRRVPTDRRLSLRLFKIAGIAPESWDVDDAHGPTVGQTLTAVKTGQGDSVESPSNLGVGAEDEERREGAA